MSEITYIKSGEVYKKTVPAGRYSKRGHIVITASMSSTGVRSVYYHGLRWSSEYDRIFHFKSEKVDADGKVWVKNYSSTKQLRDLIGVAGGDVIDQFDLSPSVNLWCAVGTIEGRDDFVELYFNVESVEQLKEVASYYGLELPVSDNDLDNNRKDWVVRHFKTKQGNTIEFVGGSIVFDGGNPTILKIYKCNVPS